MEPINSSLQLYKGATMYGMPLKEGDPDRLTLASEIDDNLWQGAVPPWIGPPSDFKSILDLYTYDMYKISPGTDRREYRMDDSWWMPDERHLFDMAHWINERRKAGPVLVHCQAGLNRSGLLVGLALIKSGLDPRNAVRLIQSRRSPYALSNSFFKNWLLER